MAKLTKRQKLIREKVQPGKQYPIADALALLKELSTVKFSESIDVAVNLGVDARKSDQVVRGATTLPHGTGSVVRVAVFTQGANAEKAKAAGADLVGMEDLAEQVKAGNMPFDVVIATPDAMRVVGQLGQILGPRGLMPNPKTGTVTPDVETAVRNAKAGQVRFRADKNGIVHGAIGKVTFEQNAIKENLEALLSDLKRAKPATSKGIYLKKITLSSTMATRSLPCEVLWSLWTGSFETEPKAIKDRRYPPL
jgi:large subunit ribosomal protein L1